MLVASHRRIRIAKRLIRSSRHRSRKVWQLFTSQEQLFKTALAWQTNDRRLKATISDAWYDYTLPGNVAGVGNADSRSEFDFDIQYFFNRVNRKGPYKGFSIRQRYGDRTQTYSPYDFKYSRTQLEYTF